MASNLGDATGASILSRQETTAAGGGIWAPGGIGVDGTGNLLVATGNTAGTTTYDYGEAVLKLSPVDLSILDHYSPANWQAMDLNDQDLGRSRRPPPPILG